DAKRKALERARQLVGEGAHLGNPRLRSLRSGKDHFYRVMAHFGITKRGLGVTPHGLRHQYANDRYELCSGASSAVRHAAPVEPAVDTAARLQVAAELGHARKGIVGAYLGPILCSRDRKEEAAPASGDSL